MAKSHVSDSRVFAVPEPPCKKCDSRLDFQIFENYDESGMDWIQWFCKNHCGFYYNAEIFGPVE